MQVEFYRHALTEEDIDAVSKVLRSVFLTTGPVAASFEKQFSELTGLKSTVSLNSCTGAMHLALLALGIGPGDEVIVPAMTFIATATVVTHCGARPVLVDVEPDTAMIDPAKVEAAITPRTKAIIPVHLYGAMADMRTLRIIADKHKLFLIEDCAHCIEGERDGVRPGMLSNAACYSFYATKNLTCGEGGALATNDTKLADQVRLLRQHGMSKEAADRYGGNYKHWDMIALGWKYNLNDVLSALMIHQIPRLEKQLGERERVWNIYDETCAQIPGVDVPRIAGKSARHLYTVWVPAEKRDACLQYMQERGVGVAVNYRAMHTLTWFVDTFGFKADDFPIAFEIGQRTMTLPLYPGLNSECAQYVAKTLCKFFIK